MNVCKVSFLKENNNSKDTKIGKGVPENFIQIFFPRQPITIICVIEIIKIHFNRFGNDAFLPSYSAFPVKNKTQGRNA